MCVRVPPSGLDEAERLPRLHHLLQTGAAGSPGLQTQVVEVPDPGRGAEHQELQVAALAEPAELQQVGGAVFFPVEVENVSVSVGSE